MKLLLSSFLLLSLNVVQAKVIYGDDHRVEVSDGNPIQKKLSLGAATMIPKESIVSDSGNSQLVNVSQKTLKDWLESMETSKGKHSPKLEEAIKNGMTFCESERFTDQPNAGMCSGFLIAHDLLVTAGHCVEVEKFCENYQWVFGFQVNPETKKAGLGISKDDVYSCKKVISHSLSTQIGTDYALVQLDRSVKGRSPLEIRVENTIEDLAGLFVIGSPSGLPLKIAGGASVRTNSHPLYFTANLDTFQGNSGSAVFNATTGIVEGILVRGENDFVPNVAKGCIEANKCKDNECRGEDVSRMSSIPEIGVKVVLDRAAASGDLEALKKLLSMNIWPDIYLKNGLSPLAVASMSGKAKAVKLLLEKGANPKLTDNEGDSILHKLATVIRKEHLDALKILMSAKVDLEAKNIHGETPLHAAAKAKNKIGAKLLIQNGADKNALDDQGETILFKFARQGDFVSVINFADMGISLQHKNKKGESVIQIAKKRVLKK